MKRSLIRIGIALAAALIVVGAASGVASAGETPSSDSNGWTGNSPDNRDM
jgi:hypothetical protein